MKALLGVILVINVTFFSLIDKKNNLKKEVDNKTTCDEKLNEKLNQRFQGKADGFFKYIGKNVNYSQKARENCIMGYSIVDFDVSADNEVSNISFKNKFGYGIEEDISEVLKNSTSKWIKSSDITESTHFQFTVKFTPALPNGKRCSQYKYNCGGVVVVVGISNNPNCPTDEDLLKRANKHLKNQKYEKLVEVYEELLRRQPLNKEFEETLEKYKKLSESK
jgi:hypothetical protein